MHAVLGGPGTHLVPTAEYAAFFGRRAMAACTLMDGDTTWRGTHTHTAHMKSSYIVLMGTGVARVGSPGVVGDVYHARGVRCATTTYVVVASQRLHQR